MKRPDRAGSATVLAEFVSVIADIYGRADFDVIIKQLCAFGRLADATVRGRIPRQDADMHPHAVLGQAQEQFHGRAFEVLPTRRGVDTRTHAGTDDAAATIDKIAVEIRMIDRICFEY